MLRYRSSKTKRNVGVWVVFCLFWIILGFFDANAIPSSRHLNSKKTKHKRPQKQTFQPKKSPPQQPEVIPTPNENQNLKIFSEPDHENLKKLTAKLGSEGRWIFRDPLYSNQKKLELRLSAEFEFDFQWDEDRQRILILPYGRKVIEDRSSDLLDLQKAYYSYSFDTWDIRVGFDRIYWGVTESQQLVDVINQTDLARSFEGKEKLGQPMLNLTISSDFGTFDFFALTGFRHRTFPGEKGRLRADPVVDHSIVEYNAPGKRWTPEAAFRWAHQINFIDIGLSYFYGFNRSPDLALGGAGNTVLKPTYYRIHHGGIDLQATLEAWIIKFEGIHRYQYSTKNNYQALTGGIEYIFYSILGGPMDIGFFSEYLWDSRKTSSPTPRQDDFYFGGRFVFNNISGSEIKAGVLLDRKSQAQLYNIKGSTRLNDHLRLALDGYLFANIPTTDPLQSMRMDDYLAIQIEWFIP